MWSLLLLFVLKSPLVSFFSMVELWTLHSTNPLKAEAKILWLYRNANKPKMVNKNKNNKEIYFKRE